MQKRQELSMILAMSYAAARDGGDYPHFDTEMTPRFITWWGSE